MTWLLDTLLATGGLIALVLVLRRPVARLFGPGLAYALWALPLLRLMLPPLVLPARAEPARLVHLTEGLDLPIALPDAPVSASINAAGPDWNGLAVLVWLAGVVVFALWRLHGYRAMRRLLLTGAVPVGQVGTVRLVESPATQAPVAFGVRDKVVALPSGFMARSDRLGRDLAIAHELEHHAARDLAVNLAMQPLLALHWFNPLAWLGWRALRRDQEAACDARVMAGAGPELRIAYGRLIAAFAQSPRLALAAPMACPVLGEASVIHRLRSLTMADPTPHRRLAGRTMIAAALLALPLTASMSHAAVDEVPVAPPAPLSPVPPGSAAAPTALPQPQRELVIACSNGAHEDQSAFKRRVVRHGGRTVVFRIDNDLTEAEVQSRIDRAMQLARAVPPEPPQPPMPPLAPDAPVAPPAPPAPAAPQAAPVTKRIVIRTPEGRQTIEVPDGDALRAQIDAEVARGLAEAERGRAEAMQGLAEAHQGMAEALASIREARSDVAGDKNLSAGLRQRILRQLDAEIERLSRTNES